MFHLTLIGWLSVAGTTWTLFLVLMLSTLSLATAASSGAPQAQSSAPLEAALPTAVVKTNANLRASPSLRGNILGLAREGAMVKLLWETDRWYRVRTAEGLEAWIRKTLVVTLQVPLTSQPVGVTQPVAPPPQPSPRLGTEGQPAPAAEQQVSPTVTEEQRSGPVIPPPVPPAEQTRPVYPPPEGPEHDRVVGQFQGLSAYVIGTLLAALLAAIGLQLRATRQLKRAMREVDQIVDHIAHPPALEPEQAVDTAPPSQPLVAVEEIRTEEARAPTGDGQTSSAALQQDVDIMPLPVLSVALSPLEQAVVEAIRDHGEIHEGVLAKTLEKRGFYGVLIKAVIGDIVRKTGHEGPPWVRVKHANGRYTYQWQVHEVSGHAGGRDRE